MTTLTPEAPGVRVAHGVLVAGGLLHLAWALEASDETTTAGHPEG